jgi:hypothetical protein
MPLGEVAIEALRARSGTSAPVIVKKPSGA